MPLRMLEVHAKRRAAAFQVGGGRLQRARSSTVRCGQFLVVREPRRKAELLAVVQGDPRASDPYEPGDPSGRGERAVAGLDPGLAEADAGADREEALEQVAGHVSRGHVYRTLRPGVGDGFGDRVTDREPATERRGLTGLADRAPLGIVGLGCARFE